jgi:hypothetical protein
MPWNMIPVKAPASAVKIPVSLIPDDVQQSIEEAFAYCEQNPAERLTVPFDTAEAAAEAKTQIRSYCEARPAGRLSASIWEGFAGTLENGNVKFSPQETEACKTPALSLFLKVYVKKERGSNGQAGAEAASGTPDGSN